MNITCDLSSNGTDCSHVFEGVHISITILQAIFNVVIFLLAFPMNVLLIAAMIIYRKMLDKTMLVTISFLISNTILSFGFSQVVVTSMLRAWVFGNWGCHVFAFITVVASMSRYTVVGVVCIARFVQVLFPHYSHQLKLQLGLLTGSWIFAILFGLLKFFSGSTGFDIAIPGCGFATDFDKLSNAYRAVFVSLLICATIFGVILPVILYTIMYFKARQLRKIVPTTQEVRITDPQTIDLHKRWRRADFTYILLMISFSCISLVIFVEIIFKMVIFREYHVPQSAVVGILFIIYDIGGLYILTDIGILLINKYERMVFVRLIQRIYNYFKL